MQAGPVVAVQWRDDRPDIIHTGHAVLLDHEGGVAASWGESSQGTYWRSAAKPFQALAVVQTGAWDALGLDARSLAVACGSHAGEVEHLDAATHTLDAAELGSESLRCGVHRPWSRHSVRPKEGPGPLHNNCSGKHAAMLAACVHEGWDLATYQSPTHPLQMATTALVAAAVGQDPREIPVGRDGCGVPTWFLSVQELARGFAWLGAHGARVLDAMAAHPKMVSGTGQFCTDLATATQGQVIGKYGALGVYGAVHRPTGQALAVKLDAGDEKAAKAVAGALMVRAGWLDEHQRQALANHLEPMHKNNVGEVVGRTSVRLDP